MKTKLTKKKWHVRVFLSLLALLLSSVVLRTSAQVGNYAFTASSGTFTPITGGTVMTLSGGSTDDGYYNNIPIGFAFSYDGNTYTTAAGCTNGWLSLVGNMTLNAWTNNLNSGLVGARPVLAPLWDDHDGTNITFTYKSELVGSDSVFTAEWLNVDWQFQGGAVISFQVKLFKNSGNIQFIYRQESTPLGFGAASIGITGVGTGNANFLSLGSAGSSPTASASVETTNIGTRPATGQVYQFSPPVPAAPVVTTGTKSGITTSQATLAGSIAPNTFPAVTASGIVYSTSPAPTLGSATDLATSPLVTTGSFTRVATGLSSGTTYYYRTYATNSLGTSYGADSTFTTNASASVPTLTTTAATAILAYTATVGGNISLDGGAAISASGVVFSSSNNNPQIGGLGVIDSTTNPLITNGAFTFGIGGLTHSTKYYFRAYASNAVGTAYGALDSFTTAPVVSTLPYSQNFDAGGTTGWSSTIVGGNLNNWVMGTPAKTSISAAYSSPNAWITKTTGNYDDNHNAAVVSPQFDLTSYTANAVLRFKHKFLTESCCDGGILEISINGGTWTKVENVLGTGTNFNTANGTAWYNLGTQGNSWANQSTGYSSHVNGWITTTISLPGSAGQSNVRFRFRFITDVSAVAEGWAIDDIEVFMPSPPTVLTGTKTGITTSFATLAGNITGNGGSAVTTSGVVIGTSPAPVRGGIGVIDSSTNPLVASGSFSINTNALAPGTTYYYRAYAVNGAGVAYGPDSTFTTNASAVVPTVVSNGKLNVLTTTATVGGNITSDGGATVTVSGIVFSTTGIPSIGGGSVDSTTNPLVTTGTYSFNLAGLTPATLYYFRAYATNAVGTAYSALDSFFTQPIVSALPYADNFDSSYTPWSTNVTGLGRVNDWVLGTPAKTFLNGAYSGSNAWTTKLTGNYSNGSDGAVISPQFDFSAQTADPILRFRHRFATVGGIDGGVVEISTNGGSTWTQLDNNLGTGANFNSTTSTSWYNVGPNGFWTPTLGNNFSGTSSNYSTQNNGWIQSTVRLTGAAGQSSVRVRFRIETTTFTFFGTQEGWEIDNVEVFPPTAPVVATGTNSNKTTSAITLNGSIVSNGNATITASGVVIGTSPAPARGAIGVIDSTTNPVVGNGSFVLNITGLTPATTYYYRAYAQNGIGLSYGPDSTFTTNASAVLATVNKNPASNVAAFSVTLSGNIPSDGGAVVTASGVVYSSSNNNPTIGGLGVIDSTTTPVVSLGNLAVNPVGLTPATKYYFRVYATNSVGTAYSILDSFTTAPVVSNFPYSQNFDAVGVNTGWTSAVVGGTLNNWDVGTPNKTSISAAYSAPNAWITRIIGNYDDNHDAALVSPQFDFTSLTVNPLLRFKHKFLTESCCDGGILEMSINGGVWTKVENVVGTGGNFNTTNGTAWYNLTTQGNSWANQSANYSSQVNGWITSMIALPGAAGQSNVKFRFRFITDGSVVSEGWAIDDIEVFAPSAPVMLTGSATNVISTTATVAGSIVNNGGSAVTASGVVISTSPSPTIGGIGVIDSATNPLVANGSFSINLTGLSTSTTYYYRAYAVNAIGTSYGADSTFTTTAGAVVPFVNRIAANAIQTTTANAGGNITSDGGSTVTASGIVYSSTNATPVVGGLGVTAISTSPLVTSGTYTLSMTGLTSATKYYYRAYATNGIGTGYSVVDSFETAPIITSLPYTQNFDGPANTGWTSAAVGGLNNWVLGTPAKSFITGAYSGTKAWVTKTAGNYDDNHDAAVVSPQFNLSTLTNDPVLRFRHKFRTESCCDGGFVEISLNGGGSWTRLQSATGTGGNFNTTTAYAWYNAATQGNSWAGNSTPYTSQTNGWIESAVVLTGAAGQSDVRVRFHFISDGSVVDDGWVIDDIEVGEVITPTIASSNVSATPGATTAGISFSAGNGQGRLVVARLATTTAVAPTDNTLYTASATFGSGSTTGTGNFVVYSGTGTSASITGLTQLTNYAFDVYEYNGRYMHIKFTASSNATTTTTPVKLLSFSASKSADDVQLKWSTASERNNKGFAVERSADGKTFEQVAFVAGKGNSNTKVSYATLDRSAFTKTGVSRLYYRLKQVDVNGDFEYSETLIIDNDEVTASNMNVYPNPFNSTVSIMCTAKQDGEATIRVTDISGREVIAMNREVVKGSNSIQLEDMEQLKQGVYFVSVQIDGQTQVTKLVKN